MYWRKTVLTTRGFKPNVLRSLSKSNLILQAWTILFFVFFSLHLPELSVVFWTPVTTRLGAHLLALETPTLINRAAIWWLGSREWTLRRVHKIYQSSQGLSVFIHTSDVTVRMPGWLLRKMYGAHSLLPFQSSQGFLLSWFGLIWGVF